MLLGQFHHRTDHTRGGIRDEQVESAKRSGGLIDQGIAALGVIDATLDCIRSTTQRLDLRQCLLGGIAIAQVGEGDRGATLDEIEGNRTADATRAARHECETAVEGAAHAGVLGSPQSPLDDV